MASLQPDEKAYLWHLVLMEEVNEHVIIWSKYKKALKHRFGHPYKSPMGELKKLRQRDTLEEYNNEFDILRRKLHLSETRVVQAKPMQRVYKIIMQGRFEFGGQER